MQKFCCEECQTKAKEARKKRQQDFMNAVEPLINLQQQEYLTFAKAAILMGCSRQYVYKLVNEGKLAASRISSRMAFIRKVDIEKMRRTWIFPWPPQTATTTHRQHTTCFYTLTRRFYIPCKRRKADWTLHAVLT